MREETKVNKCYLDLHKASTRLYSGKPTCKSVSKTIVGKYVFPILHKEQREVFELSSEIAREKIIKDIVARINFVVETEERLSSSFAENIYEEKCVEDIINYFKIKAPKEFLMNIEKYNEIMKTLRKKRSPKLEQLCHAFYEVVDLYNSNHEMTALISEIDEEVKFCNAGMPSGEIPENMLHEIVHDTKLILVKEEEVQKKEEPKKEEQNELVNLVELLGYSSGAGITSMVNKSEDKSLARLKPYTSLKSEDVLSILLAVKPVCASTKLKKITGLIEKYTILAGGRNE